MKISPPLDEQARFRRAGHTGSTAGGTPAATLLGHETDHFTGAPTQTQTGIHSVSAYQPNVFRKYSMLFVAMTSAPSSNLKTSTET